MSYYDNENGYDLEAVQYGGFWIRFLARAIDNGIFVFVWILGLLIYFSTLHVIDYKIYKLLPFYFPLYFFDESLPVGGALIIFIILYLIGYFLYYVLMHGFMGATLGKMVTGIVVKEEGTLRDIGIGKAIGRFFALEFISGIVFYLGFLWAAWDEEKQSWHDKLARTVVVYKNSVIGSINEINEIEEYEEPVRDYPRMHGKEFGEFVFTKGMNRGKHISLRGESVKVGRKREDVHISVNDPEKFVSRIQCEIFAKNNRYYLRNLSSNNTTILNGKTIRSEVLLRDRDIISFGSHSAKILFF